jgi:hypothetical protein
LRAGLTFGRFGPGGALRLAPAEILAKRRS